MSWFDRFRRGSSGGAQPGDDAANAARLAEWESALESGRIPYFVEARLAAAAAGKTPWIATATPVEFGLLRAKGVRPLAMVSGTCWYHYGYSWTHGHYDGWHAALARLRQEALAAGANAVVDVKLRKIQLAIGASMDFTVIGTAVRIDGLPQSGDPLIATVPALEFVRLLEAGIVPVGLAIGAEYQWLSPMLSLSAMRIDGARQPFTSMPLTELSQFWERVRRRALAQLRRDTQRQGDGVLAHLHFGQLLKIEQGDNNPPRFLGRHIVLGTVVDSRRSAANVSHDIGMVVNMADGASLLPAGATEGHNIYSTGSAGDEEGAI